MTLSPPLARRLVAVQLIGLAVGAAAVAARWALRALESPPVPPGLIILALAAGLLTVVRRPVTVTVGAAAGALVLIQLLPNATSEVLFGGRGAGVAVSVWLQLGGVTAAVLAGVAALVMINRADRLHEQPRQGWGRWAQVAGLLVMAPVCAEYLSAYDDSTGDPAKLLGNLLIFVPLYGCPALLIREGCRRAGLGWPGIVLLAAVFGLLQAGVVDQSLFSADYRQIDGWDESFRATLVAPLGISAFNAVNFVGGHVVFSICAPIALVEAARPREATSSWLGAAGLAVTAVAYFAASAFVLQFHLTTETSHASIAQLAVCILLIGGLTLAAVAGGRRTGPIDPRTAPPVRAVLGVALVASIVSGLAPETWTGVGLTAGVWLVAALGIGYSSRRVGWGLQHVAVLAAAPLVVRAVLAFTYDPLVGEVSDLAKYMHNTVMLAVVLLAALLSLRPRARAAAPE